MIAEPRLLRLEAFLDQFLDPAFLIDVESGRIVYSNRPAAELLGCDSGDLSGSMLEDWVFDGPAIAGWQESQRRHLRQMVGRVAAQERFQIPFRRGADSHAICEMSLTPVSEPESAAMIVAVARDVTSDFYSRREMETNLELVREQVHLLDTHRGPLLMRQLLDLAPDAVIVRDLTGRVLFWNQAAGRMYGWSASEAEGANCHDLLRTDFADSREDRDGALARTGRWQGEFRQWTKDGTVLHVRGHWSLHWSESGRPAAILEINRDVTDQKAAADKLAQHARELARSNADLEQFAYLAAHDMREPLRVVVSYLRLLDRRYGDQPGQDARRLIHQALDAAGRMQGLISNLLVYARVDATEVRAQPVDALEAFRDAVGDLDGLIAEVGATVRADPLPVVTADRIQLTQLLQNLIANAVKFRSSRPVEVSVSAQRRSDEWVFAVRDNGIGIAPDQCDRIFGLFQRIHGRGQYPGNGLGLSICRRIVERHGGRIWAQSEPGQGSTFFFSLPAPGRGLVRQSDAGLPEASTGARLGEHFLVG